MAQIDSDLKRIAKERKQLEHEIQAKEEIYKNMEQIKADRKKLNAVEADIHPTKFHKIEKAMGKALAGLKKGKTAYMESYKARHQDELHAVHRRKMNEVA